MFKVEEGEEEEGEFVMYVLFQSILNCTNLIDVGATSQMHLATTSWVSASSASPKSSGYLRLLCQRSCSKARTRVAPRMEQLRTSIVMFPPAFYTHLIYSFDLVQNLPSHRLPFHHHRLSFPWIQKPSRIRSVFSNHSTTNGYPLSHRHPCPRYHLLCRIYPRPFRQQQRCPTMPPFPRTRSSVLWARCSRPIPPRPPPRKKRRRNPKRRRTGTCASARRQPRRRRQRRPTHPRNPSRRQQRRRSRWRRCRR